MITKYTERQRQYLAFIHRYTVKRGIAPSFEEIGTHFGTSAPSVNNMIKTLCARGLLSKVPGAARSLRVLVPASMLGESDLDGHRRKLPSNTEPASLSTVDAVTAAVVAVLDVLMPQVQGHPDAPQMLMEAARAAGTALSIAGISEADTQEVVQRLRAEIARWMPEGRGIRVSRRRWSRVR